MILRLFLTLLACSLLVQGCEFSPTSYKKPTDAGDKAISLTVRWKVPSGEDPPQSMALSNGVLYWADIQSEKVESVDVMTGKVLWLSSRLGRTQSNPLVTEKAVYVMAEWGGGVATKIFALDKGTGALLSTITLPSDAYHLRMFTWTTLPGYLVWHAAKIGLVALPESSIDFTVPAQSLTPQTLFPGVYDGISPVLAYNGKLYFSLRKSSDTYTLKADGDDIVVMDALDFSLVTRIVLDFSVSADDSPLAVYKDKIYYQGLNALFGINPGTNALFFSLPRDVDHASGRGLAFHNDKVYFTSSLAGDGPYQNNLTCRSAVDGHLVWAVNASKFSLGFQPVIHNGILYILTQNDFRLFNAETGDLLGLDPVISGYPVDTTYQLTPDDGDTMYFKAVDSVYAVKLDWKLDANGKLTR